ncbi:MAG: FkbM family methyltransferase [Methanobrevibacter sp. CfCl-M3]
MLKQIIIAKEMIKNNFIRNVNNGNYHSMDFIYKNLYNNPKYLNSKRITHYGKSAFSQNGEDGLIKEIFNRIDTTNKYFVEFGVENGLECNTTFLLLNGWKGLWIEADEKSCSEIQENFKEVIKKEYLKVKNSFITPENIEEIFDEFEIPKSPDLLSIDIDSTDYWVRKAIKKYTPRVLIMEYNDTYFPPTVWIQKKDKATWEEGINYGASLQALHDLNKNMGYTLIGCDFNGVNAFFIRNDCYSEELFEKNTSAEYHYENQKQLSFYYSHKRTSFDLGQKDI